MKKNCYLIIACVVLVLAIIIIFVGDKSLDITSEEITKLYNTLGTPDLNICGGLNTYTAKELKVTDIPLENRLCEAYYNMDDKDKINENIKSNKVSSSKNPLCEIEEGISFLASSDTKECSYSHISKESINTSYKALFGTDITEYLPFNLTSDSTCFMKDEEYYCGSTETINMTLNPDTNILRLKNKALKTYSGEIIIEDYFLRISGGKCYLTNGLGEESTDCTTALSKYEDFNTLSDEEKNSFIKKYGQKYRHVFKKDADNNYYWYKSYQK